MFIKSAYPYEIEIAGVLIPKRSYSVNEMNYGKRSFIKVTDEELKKLKEDGVFKALLESKKYTLLEKMPASLLSTSDKLKESEQRNKEILAEKEKDLTALKEENDRLKKESSAKDVEDSLLEKEAELVKLKKENEKLKKKNKELNKG